MRGAQDLAAPRCQHFARLRVARIGHLPTVPPPHSHPRVLHAELISRRSLANPASVAVQYLHDLRLVRPSQYKTSALWIAIVASWGIAFFEYCLAVPANRIGAEVYSAAQLKTMQEVITLIVFTGFSVFFLKESLTINHAIGFALIAAGAAFVFRG